MLERLAHGQKPLSYSDADVAADFNRTVAFWRGWLRRSSYSGCWRETVHRSALTLKLLTYAPTGAIVAAPTTSLPEQLGGQRNWDYRYTWMRDAAFTLYALLRIGFTDEARALLEWLQARIRQAAESKSGPLQIMYGIDGREELPEEHLPHLGGYISTPALERSSASRCHPRQKLLRLSYAVCFKTPFSAACWEEDDDVSAKPRGSYFYLGSSDAGCD